jgi:hypothetical protein
MSLQKQTVTPTISGVAANAAEASRTQEVSTRHAASIGFGIDLTWAAASAITVQLFKSADGTNYERVPSLSIDTGTGTASDYTVSKAVSASDTLWVDLDCENAVSVKIIVGATGGGAADLLTVRPCTSSWS